MPHPPIRYSLLAPGVLAVPIERGSHRLGRQPPPLVVNLLEQTAALCELILEEGPQVDVRSGLFSRIPWRASDKGLLPIHAAVFALSVVNEIPSDVVRYSGRRRMERFVEELLDAAKQVCPDCLVTFANFPPAEFLHPAQVDFYCFNVYLHDMQQFARYLERLQHVAGNLPLVVGEFGIDSLREGETAQAELVAQHVRTAFTHGLARRTFCRCSAKQARVGCCLLAQWLQDAGGMFTISFGSD